MAMTRFLDLSSDSDLGILARMRYDADAESLPPGMAVPAISLEERFWREQRRRQLAGLIAVPFTVVEPTKSAKDFKAMLDGQFEPCSRNPKPAMLLRGYTSCPHRREQAITRCIEYAIDMGKTKFLRAALETPVSDGGCGLLRKYGFQECPWHQLTGVYESNDFSLLFQAFWEACIKNSLPFKFGESNELEITIATQEQLKDLTELQLALAKATGTRADFEKAEASVWYLINRQQFDLHNSTLLVVLKNQRVIGSVRVSPSYGPSEGLLRLSIRNIVLAPAQRGKGLLPWVFSASVIAGRMLLNPDLVSLPHWSFHEPIFVETWLPNESLIRHFIREVPRLSLTKIKCFENY
jgi:Acetyltransferase (GNAT) family